MHRPLLPSGPLVFPFPPDRRPAATARPTKATPWVWRQGLPLALSLGLLWVGSPAHASPLDWLATKRPPAKRATNAPGAPLKRSVSAQTADLPDFFATKETGPDLDGSSLSPLKFAETHWMNAKGNLEKATRGIQAKILEKKCQDLVGKLFIVDSQTYKEILKNAASGLQSLGGSVRTVNGLLIELNRIVTAPREETLDTLERTLARIKTQNDALLAQVRAHVAGVERMITLSQEAYQTLELIPSLSLPPIDLYVQASKQVMKLAQSSSEAQKGLLFNVQNGAEQVTATLETMVSTIRTTLRFSDHFAFRQFPLINLPVPTREKLFAQLSALKNAAKGIQNTLSIGDSHLKNSAQQFTHLSQSVWTKIADALKYQGQTEYGVENLPQISGYSYNQVCGLYQRVKDGINEMKMTMAKEGRSAPARANRPAVAIETEDQFLARKAQVANGKLPLFLLGEASGSSAESALPAIPRARRQNDAEMTVLYSERETPTVVKEQLLPDEVDILQQELGNLMSGADPEGFAPEPPAPPRRQTASRPPRGLPSPKQALDLIPPTSELDEAEQGIAQAALPSDAGDFRGSELLRMESTGAPGETADLIPMFRLEDFSPPPEKD